MMGETFDAYHKWLGISPEEQPPNRYRLLGIKTFESDPDVISSAADQRMVHVRGFQTGEHAELSQQILNELSLARICLLDAQKKAEYDQELTRRFAFQHRASKELLSPLRNNVSETDYLIRFHCGACGKRLGAKPSQTGKQFPCVYCGARVMVPSIGSEDRPLRRRPPPAPRPQSFQQSSRVIELPPTEDQRETPTEAVACPHCDQPIIWDSDLAGRAVTCPSCGALFEMSFSTTPAPLPPPRAEAKMKTCPMCAEQIAAQAIKCKHCGAMFVPTQQTGSPLSTSSSAGVTVPVLISAIGNIFVGLMWLATCFGIIFAIPMFLLCIFEFAFYAKANRLHPASLASQATTLGVFEIIVGLANLVSLICGIIVLINASKLRRE